MRNRPLQKTFAHMAALVLTGAVVFLPSACGSPIRTPAEAADRPPGVPENYPPRVLESAEHRESIAAEWRRLFESLGVPPEAREVPDLAPITHTPQSLLGRGPIPLADATESPIPEERVRLLLRDFIADHSQLLGVSPRGVSLVEVSGAGATGQRYRYAQMDYAHPIADPFGRLEFVVSPAGRIVQISDTMVPVVELPAEPRISREAAVAQVLGRTFTYGDIAGRPQSVTISDPENVDVRRLVVYPEVNPEAMIMHLAWEVVAGQQTGMSWTVFIDAITGAPIATRQNFQT